MKRISSVVLMLVLVISLGIIPVPITANSTTSMSALTTQIELPGAGGEITYQNCASTFTGSVKVWGLEYGTEYQLKLEGMPTCYYDKGGDDWSNLAMGSIGRWWKKTPLPEENVYDDNWYVSHPEWCVLGYLLFGCFTFTPGPDGIMTISIKVDSSYHICGEPQTGRPAPGTPDIMPKGSYKARLNITEEVVPHEDYRTVFLSEEALEFTVAAECPCEGGFVDVGDPVSEAGHDLDGWGPIEPATHGGQWGASGPTPPSDNMSGFVKKDGTQFLLNGKPYLYAGTNYWYGLNLAMSESPGDRGRLEQELDYLHSLGITNLRVMAGSEGPNTEPWRMVPALQTAPGIYDPLVLNGLDYLLYAMKIRNMRAVMCLTNFWPWSGGMAQYVNWNGGGDIPYPPPEEGGDWNTYQDYASDFYSNAGAMDDYQDHIEYLIDHVNPYTGMSYLDEPAIMAWELANEPRGYNNNAVNFNLWLDDTAAFIKDLDPNHLVTTGCEGDTPWPAWNGLDFISNHDGSNIDYTTIHIWPENWGWYNPANPEGTYSTAESNAQTYFDAHIAGAVSLNKPLVLEEFGLARDSGSYDPLASTSWRDQFFTAMYEHVYDSANSGGPVAGDNFWAWAGEGRPLVPYGSFWSPGDPWIGDPPHERQGWYSVYDSDATTLAVISGHASDMNALSTTHGGPGVDNCRCIWDKSDNDPTAYVTLTNCFDQGAQLMLNIRHLDGIADDSFGVEVMNNSDAWVNIGYFTDWLVGIEEPTNQETWLVTDFELSGVMLDAYQPVEVKLTATGTKWSGFNTFGQVAFDWIALCDDPAPGDQFVQMKIDIKPTSCPNPLNIGSNGVVSVAAIGTDEMDVEQINPNTVEFGPGSDPFDGIIPLRWSYEDVATPYMPNGEEPCLACTTEGPDGYLDIVFKFDKQELIEAIGDVEDGQCLMLTLAGSLYDGTVFSGSDIVRIIDNSKGPPVNLPGNGKNKNK
ncbi:cellulase family glycosylhydrolase [Chloroflexota bacterium]